MIILLLINITYSMLHLIHLIHLIHLFNNTMKILFIYNSLPTILTLITENINTINKILRYTLIKWIRTLGFFVFSNNYNKKIICCINYIKCYPILALSNNNIILSLDLVKMEISIFKFIQLVFIPSMHNLLISSKKISLLFKGIYYRHNINANKCSRT